MPGRSVAPSARIPVPPLEGYPISTVGCTALSRSTASASARVTGTDTIWTGPPPVASATNLLVCNGAAAATIAMTIPSGDRPAASRRAMVLRLSEAAMSAYSPIVCTNTPRCPGKAPGQAGGGYLAEG